MEIQSKGFCNDDIKEGGGGSMCVVLLYQKPFLTRVWGSLNFRYVKALPPVGV